MRKPVLVTHNDLDGVGCAVLLTRYCYDLDHDNIYYCGYDDVNEVVRKVAQRNIDLYITDISVSEEVADYLDKKYTNKSIKVTLLDHHKGAMHLNKYPWVRVVPEGECGTSLVFEYLIGIYGYSVDLCDYSDFVKLVKDYDLWLHKDIRSLDLNLLLSRIGKRSFVERFAYNPEVKWSYHEGMIIDDAREEMREYIQKATERAIYVQTPVKVGVNFCEQYISQVGHAMLSNCDIALVVNFAQGKASLRSSKYDMNEIAKALGGGGHVRAAGFEIPAGMWPGDIVEMFFEKAKTFIREEGK